MTAKGNIYFLTDDQREGVLWAIRLAMAYDDGFSFPRDQNREILGEALIQLGETSA